MPTPPVSRCESSPDDMGSNWSHKNGFFPAVGDRKDSMNFNDVMSANALSRNSFHLRDDPE